MAQCLARIAGPVEYAPSIRTVLIAQLDEHDIAQGMPQHAQQAWVGTQLAVIDLIARQARQRNLLSSRQIAAQCCHFGS
ncbi:hypothetical protein OXL99_16050 [Pseudomonas fulva]|nr:hypothetical protein OXL99_16050 [Pseudomonas fulva]